eukprot:EC123938.1.p2 GENE.EC123938.1~~EC123938.1.p2  ORF type:complete len:100 (+),score=19.04 EC123938.1:103-402(+)
MTDAATGTGPVDAAFKAIQRIVDIPGKLLEYQVHSVTAGIDAVGEVTIRMEYNNRVFSAHAANTDIVVASARAYLNAVNRVLSSPTYRVHAQHSPQPVA